MRRLIEKAIDINIRKQTGRECYRESILLEEPMKLYRCEKASLYLGFSLNVYIKQKQEGDLYNSQCRGYTASVCARKCA